MRLTALDEPEVYLSESRSSATSSATLESAPRPFLDLAVRHKLQDNRSTITTLESLASSIEDLDKTLKRSRDIICTVDKESQVKEQRNSFKGIFPSGDCKDSPKKSRTNQSTHLIYNIIFEDHIIKLFCKISFAQFCYIFCYTLFQFYFNLHNFVVLEYHLMLVFNYLYIVLKFICYIFQ